MKPRSIVEVMRLLPDAVNEFFALGASPAPDHPQVRTTVERWLQRAVTGYRVTMFSPVCPDYAHSEGRYTFDSLGGGVGLVASRILGVLPSYWAFCQKYSIDVRFVVAISDHEAKNADNCARVGVSECEFLARIRKSQERFLAACPQDMPIQCPFFTEVGNVGEWDQIFSTARRNATRKSGLILTGRLPFTPDAWEEIVRTRGRLYKRWYGSKIDTKKILFAQVPEYMALGTLAERVYNRMRAKALILAADSTLMSPFVQGLGQKVRPVVYLRSNEY